VSQAVRYHHLPVFALATARSQYPLNIVAAIFDAANGNIRDQDRLIDLWKALHKEKKISIVVSMLRTEKNHIPFFALSIAWSQSSLY
tara:strand:+ start:191 stop:451 length:261 start_codon:yes stop_codon:yes gene_type:complete